MALRQAGSSMMAAGVKSVTADEGAQYCLKYEARPPTPHNEKKFRKSFFNPGDRHVHPGMIDDAARLAEERKRLPNSKATFGVSSAGSQHVPDVFTQGPQTDVESFLNEKKEEVYRNKSKLVLGKPRSHGTTLPAKCVTKEFSFGCSTLGSESAKNLLYPVSTADTKASRDMYIKSHGSFRPGEQRSRQYEWGAINPTGRRFGSIPSATTGETTAQCLDQTVVPGLKKTRIIAKSTADFKQTADKLGKCKDLGLGKAPDAHIFGVPSAIARKGADKWTAGDCIRGQYTITEQLPDEDLGCSNRPGWRNIATDDRAFGCPTIRRDIHIPAVRSVADNNNYGTDATAASLLYPSRFTNIGVDDNEFVKARAAEDIRSVFEACGFKFSDEDFACLYWKAATNLAWNKDGGVSIEEFRAAVNELEDCKAKGAVPDWWETAKKEFAGK